MRGNRFPRTIQSRKARRGPFLVAVAVLLVPGLSGCPQARGPESRLDDAARTNTGAATAPTSSGSALPKATEEALARFNRGGALLEQYRYADAAEAFEEVVTAFPSWTAARYNLGLALLNQQDQGSSSDALARAEKELQRVLEDDPEHLWAHFGLGVYYQHVSENEQALEHFQKVYQADPGDGYAAYKYAELLGALDRNEEAIEVLEALIARDPGFVSGFFRLGNLYNRTRQREKALAVFQRFKQLNGEELAVGSFGVRDPYAAMGKYYMALTADGLPVAPRTMSPAPRILFAPDPLTLAVPLHAWRTPEGELDRPGIAVGDVDDDGDLDLVIAGAGEDGSTRLLQNDGQGHFTPGPPLVDKGTVPCLGDVDNDGDLDLWLGRAGQDQLWLNDGAGRFSPAPQQPGAEAMTLTASARLIDLDSDGDLDLFAMRRGTAQPADPAHGPVASRLYRNRLDGAYDEVAATLGLDLAGTSIAAVIADDCDSDRDLDLIVLPASGTPMAWENFRVGRYRFRDASETGLDAQGAVGATSGDPFKTGRRDLVVFTGGEVVLYHNEGGWKYRRDEEFGRQFGALGGTGGQFVDIDNDGDLDLWIFDAHRRDGRRGPVLLLNDWPARQFVDAAQRDPGNLLTALEVEGNAAGVAADFDGDGRCDLLLAAAGRSPLLIKNATRGGHWLELDLVGKRPQDQTGRSPNSAIGARVEFRSGTVTQHEVVGTPAGASVAPPLRLHFGLGDQASIEWLRVFWPDSLLQAELELTGDRVLKLEEVCRRTTSCPHLFAWDGRQFAFVSDFGGVGGLGYLVAPGTYARPDPSEIVRLPALAPRGGRYIVQVVEPLEEVVYFDHAALLAVDHPDGTEVVPNEMAAVTAEPPPFEIFCFRDPIAPEHAIDGEGHDVTEALLRGDRRYASPPQADRRFAGYASPHHVDLDFGDRLAEASARRPILVLDGWVEYSTSTSNYAASQAGRRLEAPSVFVERAGQWVELAHEVGYPAGINHLMTLDLSGKLQSGDRRLRIASTMDLSWDRIFVAVHEPEPPVTLTERAAIRADLHFLGYPREYSPDGGKPNLLDYANVDRSNTWLKMPGTYTRYGDVRELTSAVDDRFAIMASGDELTLEFPADAFPPVRPGWRRSFLLKTDSYCKDMDLYTGASDRLEPLPFHAMHAYPYGPEETIPVGAHARSDRSKYQTRKVGP